ncbi:MAG: glycosyltransferase family 4 protein [Phycisphaeraceae bacterium]
MRIVYVSQYFPPEVGAPAARVSELARAWVEQGHDVTVLTAFAHHPTGVKQPADRRRLTRRESLDGIHVIRAYVWATANEGTVKRMISYASFMVAAVVVGLFRLGRADVIVATSPQLLTAVAGYVLARLKRVPFVLEVRDLWPESIMAVDAMKENFIIRRLRDVAAYLYRHSDRIVTVGEGYREQITKRYGIDPSRMTVIPNGIDARLFEPGEHDNDVRRELGWGDRFVVMYLGTHGMAHALHRVIEAADRLRDRDDIRFVFVGEGAEKRRLQQQAAELELANVEFIGQQPKERVRDFYAACDLGLVTLRRTDLFQDVLPSKIFELLGMKRPVVLSVDGHARRLVEEAGGGWFVPPEDVDALVDAILHARGHPAELATMGEAGRSYILAHYDRRALAGQYVQLLREVVER